MDLVRNDQHIVGIAEFDESGELVIGEDPPGGIVRIAEVEELDVGVRDLCLEIIEVDVEGAVTAWNQPTGDEGSTAFKGRLGKVAIRRRERDRGFARLEVALGEGIDGRHDATRRDDVRRVRRPAISTVAPAGKRVVERRSEHGAVSENRARFGPLHDCLSRRGWTRERHVGHPHRQRLIIRARELYRVLACKEVAAKALVGHGIGIASIDDRVEVEVEVGGHRSTLRSVRPHRTSPPR